jgi:predicted flap endonuclease-1-like 5' DNA nuclease
VQEAAPEQTEMAAGEGTGQEGQAEEFDLLGGETEKSLSDEDIEAITSSRLGTTGEEDVIPDFLKEGAPLAAAAGVGAVAAAVIASGKEEGEAATEAEAAPQAAEEEQPTGEALESPAELPAAEVLPVAAVLTAVEAMPEEEAPLAAEVPPAEEHAGEAISAPVEAAVEEAPPQAEATPEEILETPEQVHAKFGQDIQGVAGIGPTYGEKLRSAGISAPLLLFRNGATAKGRQQIAEATGISESLILKWVNHVDLFRIKGVSEAYAELLETAGVDTVPELSMRNPKNLHAKLVEVIGQKRTYLVAPDPAMVENWVAQAKKLPRAIHY